MKGLFIKDLKLLRNQKRTLLLAIALMIFFAFTMEDGLFVVNYISFFGVIVAIGTLSYDEINNGMTFMFTLPVTRRQYVLEKFLFCICTALVIWICALAVSLGFMYYKGTLPVIPEFLLQSVTGPILASVLISIMLPLQIKLGQEKARSGVFVLAGIVALVFIVLKLWVAPTDAEMDALLSGISGVSLGTVMAVIGAAALILLVVSYFITVAIINRKEY